MSEPLLKVEATCRDNATCAFRGEDLFVDVRVTNTQSRQIGFPVDYVQTTGPTIRLVDTRTQAETYLRTNPASTELREKLTSISPGESATVEWVITAYELEQLSGRVVDVTAEITLSVNVKYGNEWVPFRGMDMLHIVSKR
jgi:hypothetical protein